MPPPRLFSAFGALVREGFLDPPIRSRIAAIMRRDAGAPATIFANRDGVTVNPSIRRAWEVELPTDVSGRLAADLDALRPDLESAFRVRLGPSEGFSAVKYPAGAFYRPHRDRHTASEEDGSHLRAVSIVIFVNDPLDTEAPFSGGALRFFGLLDDARAADVGLDLVPEAGTLTAFPSTWLHEVAPVESGERYTLVTWIRRADP